MRITYVSPNRSHHYPYAAAFERAGILEAFVSGFPRWSPRAGHAALGRKLIRKDVMQTVYLASLRGRLPQRFSETLAYLSKGYLDLAAAPYALSSDVFLYYNGCGLRTGRKVKRRGSTVVCEVVNSHVENQDRLLREEHERLGLPFRGIHPWEVRRRLKEYAEADYILCPSEFVRRSFLERGFAPERLLKNTFGFEQPSGGKGQQNQNVANHGTDPSTFRVLYVGSISVRKGLRYLVEAFAGLDVPNKTLELVGSGGGYSGLEGLALSKEVHLRGILKGEDLAAAYRSADVFVLPAIEEGLALVQAEALSFGLPVIATENTGADDLFSDGEAGLIVPIRDAPALRNALQRMADQPALRREMSQNARRIAADLAGWTASGDRLAQTLMGLKSAK